MTTETIASELERLARYDALVGSLIAWRARLNEVVASSTDRDAVEAARALSNAHGKHLVDASVIRQLAAVYDDAPTISAVSPFPPSTDNTP